MHSKPVAARLGFIAAGLTVGEGGVWQTASLEVDLGHLLAHNTKTSVISDGGSQFQRLLTEPVWS